MHDSFWSKNLSMQQSNIAYRNKTINYFEKYTLKQRIQQTIMNKLSFVFKCLVPEWNSIALNSTISMFKNPKQTTQFDQPDREQAVTLYLQSDYSLTINSAS